jgi:hypothetical protein
MNVVAAAIAVEVAVLIAIGWGRHVNVVATVPLKPVYQLQLQLAVVAPAGQ